MARDTHPVLVQESDEDTADQTPRDRFRRLAPKRVDLAIERLRLVGNLAGERYEYTPEDVAKIMGALRFALEEVASRFHGKPARPKFSLD